jgi:hypothetical protein
MAMLIFDGDENSLTLVDAKGKAVGTWQATNRPESTAPLRYIPNGDYSIMPSDRHVPHRHGNDSDNKGIRKDSPNGMFGPFGIFRLSPVQRNGLQIGHANEPLCIHSGRFYLPDGRGHRGPFHATKGCIRTSDRAMLEITKAVAGDSLTTLVVRNNGGIPNASNKNAQQKK